MNVERQGRNECQLSTMAALAGEPLDLVRSIAANHIRSLGWADWKQFVASDRPRGQWNATVSAIARTLGIPPTLVSGPQGPQSDETATGSIRRLSNRIRKLPARGRGAVRVARRVHRGGHIMPWQDGQVIDPSDCVPRTLAEWRRAHPRCHVTWVSYEDSA